MRLPALLRSLSVLETSSDPEPPESERAAVQAAVQYCPTQALKIVDA